MTRSRDVADTQDNLGGAVAPFVAGKNKIINGDFNVWQRGTSFTPTFGSFAADRFFTVFNGSGSTRNISRQTFTPGAAPVSGYEGTFFLRYATTVAGTGEAYSTIGQNIENVRTLAGQTATISFWAKAASSITLPYVNIVQRFGTGGSSEVVTSPATNVAITTSWTRYSYTFTMPSVSGKTIGTDSYVLAELYTPLNSTYTFDTWGWQLEAGSVATPFQTAAGSISGELALCQRYYQKSYNQSAFAGSANDNIGIKATSTSSTIANTGLVIPITFPVTMRSTPTATVYGYGGTVNNVSNGGGTDLGANTGIAIHLGQSGFNIQNQSSTITPSYNAFMAHYIASAEL
jgi:hypothetical protein